MNNHVWDHLFEPHRQSSASFIMNEFGNTVSYSEYIDRCRRLAAGLVTAGIRPGDRIAVQADKSVEILVLYGASMCAGAVFLPLNTAYTTSEIAYFLKDATPSILVCDEDRAPRLESLADTGEMQILLADGDSARSLASLEVSHQPLTRPVSRQADDVAAILYTSGTTGRAKGAMLTHDNLLSNSRTLVKYWGFDHSDVLLHALPIFHAHGLFVAVNTILSSGASMIFLPSFKVDDVIERLPQATTMMGVPTFYTRLLDDERFDRSLVSRMRLFISGSAPLLVETHTAFEQRTGHAILERYGMTETTMITSNPYRGERRPGTVGFALPQISVRICDPENGQPVPKGEVGVIEVRGPNVFEGYWNMPDKTDEEFRNDGFFITGDLARFDEDGYIEIVGRNKDLIISGGYNVYPKEVEQLLNQQDDVLESAVFGVPHADFGEAVVAVVVPIGASQLDEDAMSACFTTELANYKRPKKIFAVDNLPRNAMGKVQKKLLQESFAKTFQSS